MWKIFQIVTICAYQPPTNVSEFYMRILNNLMCVIYKTCPGLPTMKFIVHSLHVFAKNVQKFLKWWWFALPNPSKCYSIGSLWSLKYIICYHKAPCGAIFESHFNIYNIPMKPVPVWSVKLFENRLRMSYFVKKFRALLN